MRRVWFTAALAVLGTLFSSAHAADGASPPPPPPPRVSFAGLPASAAVTPKNMDDTEHAVTARLVADSDTAVPGATIRLGIHLTQKPGWHTYWHSNSEVGQPTEITWSGPDGATFGDYAYPIPQRFDQLGQVSFGYDKEVLLFTEVEVPADLEPGETTFEAKASWLACEAQCIPGSAELSLPLQVAASDSGPNTFTPLFDHYAKQHPSALADAPFDVALELDAVKPAEEFTATIRVTPREGVKLADHKGENNWPTFTPIVNTYEWMYYSGEIAREGDALVVKVIGEVLELDELPEASVIGGLFQIEADGKLIQTEFSAPLAIEAPTPVADDAAATDADGAAAAAPGGEPVLTDEVCAAMVPQKADNGFLLSLLAAFGGGLILNFMPCVLPVLTLKLYSLIEQVDISPREQKIGGLAYTAGIVVSFLALASVIVGLKLLAGEDVGWGFQFQSPAYVVTLGTIVFVFGLSLFGVFELPAIGGNAASSASSKEGPLGYFFTGVFATLLATPCSAPFLGGAMGYAFSLDWWAIPVFFAVAGLGLASPFIVIAFVPAIFKLLPRPGAWMETFKQLMGFSLVGTAIWLTSVLAGQIGVEGTFGFIWFLGAASVGAWVYGHFGGVAASLQRQLISAVVGLAVIAAGGWAFLDLEMREVSSDDSGSLIAWEKFKGDNITTLLNRYRDGDDTLFAGRPVFLDFTADWCLSCKAFERTVLETTTVAEAMEKTNAVAVKADWTRQDDNIREWLQCFGSAGVPYYAVVPPGENQPVIALGEAITTGSVTAALEQAAAQKSGDEG